MKDKKLYPESKVYYGVCECGEDCISETRRNTLTRWSEHDKKILKNDIHKNLEAIFIALLKPSLNEQKTFQRLILFRNGITIFNK